MKNPARRKTLLPLLLVFLTFISCKKSDDEGNRDYHVSFKLNGTTVNHTSGLNHGSLKISEANPNRVDFQVMSTSADFKNTIGLSIARDGAIGTQTYVNVPSAGYFPVTADYMTDQGQPAEKDYSNQDAPGRPANDFSITITKIKDDYLKGTFTGYLYDIGSGEVVDITEGEFFVRRNQ